MVLFFDLTNPLFGQVQAFCNLFPGSFCVPLIPKYAAMISFTIVEHIQNLFDLFLSESDTRSLSGLERSSVSLMVSSILPSSESPNGIHRNMTMVTTGYILHLIFFSCMILCQFFQSWLFSYSVPVAAIICSTWNSCLFYSAAYAPAWPVLQ